MNPRPPRQNTPPTPHRPGRDDKRYRTNRAHLRTYDHTCHLCGYPIDMQLRYPHPLSWECDHITPTSTLAPDDPRNWTIDNMAAAHRRCNQSRGNKTHPSTRQGLNTSQTW